MINLSKEQYLCEDLRRKAPHHTYANDEQIVLSWKCVLDLSMGIPSTDTTQMVDLLQRACGGQMQGQKVLLAMLIEKIGTHDCGPCCGDGHWRGPDGRREPFNTLSCDDCLGTGVRLGPAPSTPEIRS